MVKGIQNKQESMTAPFILLLMVSTSKWLFEDTLNSSWLELLAYIVCLALFLVASKGIRLYKTSRIWLLFIINLLFNILIHRFSPNIYGRALMTSIIVFSAVLTNVKRLDCDRVFRFIYRIGVFHAILVLLHFLLQSRWNAMAFGIYRAETYKYAVAYFRNNNYFGIIPSPHIVAGVIAFALSYRVIQNISNDRRRKREWIVPILLLGTLFLTGKRGVITCIIIAIFFAMMIKMASKKQWLKIGFFILLFAAVIDLFIYLVMRYPNNVLFARFYLFVNGFFSGNISLGDRERIYADAIELWKKNVFFGIGWRQFNRLTVSTLGYSLAHEVNCDYIQWLCEMGVLGLILNLIPMFVSLYRVIYVCRTKMNLMDQAKKKLQYYMLAQFKYLSFCMPGLKFRFTTTCFSICISLR